jgi:hypothetical protein
VARRRATGPAGGRYRRPCVARIGSHERAPHLPSVANPAPSLSRRIVVSGAMLLRTGWPWVRAGDAGVGVGAVLEGWSMAAKRSVRAALVCGVVAVMLAGCGSGSAITPNMSSAAASSALTVHSLTPATSSPAGASSGSPAPTSPRTSTSVSTSGGSAPDPAAAGRCAQQGGQVQTRSAFWGTNGNQAGWLPLAAAPRPCAASRPMMRRNRVSTWT